MYTATQAYNIAVEHNNHEYYRIYRRRVRHIMKHMTRYADMGNIRYRYYPKNINDMEVTILNQIGNELNEIGYMCKVHEGKNSKGNFLYLEVEWEKK